MIDEKIPIGTSNGKLERRKLTRWLTKYYPQNKESILEAVCSIAKILEFYGFDWVERSLDGDPVTIPDIQFEKRVDERNFDFISVGFQKYGRLQFVVTIGKMKLAKWRPEDDEYYRHSVIYYFVKKQNDGYYEAKLWGARWYHFDKLRAFKRSWQKFEETVPALMECLANGTPHPNIR